MRACPDSETRRQAASDFTRALMEQFEHQVTAIVTQYVGAYLSVSVGAGGELGEELTCVTAIRGGSQDELEEQGHGHLPPHLDRLSQIGRAHV